MQRHPIPRGRIAVLAAICSVCLSASAHAQLSSITTKLLGRIDSRRIADGAPFFVKTISAWKQGHCSIPMGATLEGRVTKVVKRGPGVKWEEVDLRFLQIPCPTDDAQEITPLLVAIHGPKKNSNDDVLAREVIMTAFAQTAGSHSASPGASGGPAAPGTLGHNTGTLGRGGFTPMSSAQEEFRAGEVRDYPAVKLALPKLTSDPTVLTSTGELFFDPDARFMIVVHLTPSNLSHGTGNEVASASFTLSRIFAARRNRKAAIDTNRTHSSAGPRRELRQRGLRHRSRRDGRYDGTGANRGSVAGSGLSTTHQPNDHWWPRRRCRTRVSG